MYKKLFSLFLIVPLVIKASGTKNEKCIFLEPGWCSASILGPTLNNPYKLDSPYPFKKLRDELKSRGYKLTLAGNLQNVYNPYAIICFRTNALISNRIKQWPDAKKILCLWEPPSIQPSWYNPMFHQSFDIVFTLLDKLVDGDRYHKMYEPRLLLPYPQFKKEFSQRKFCTLISSNLHCNDSRELYSKRRSVVRYFEQNYPHLFDLYGQRGWKEGYWPSWQGSVSNKLDVLSCYKFAICYESTADLSGYITEKIFHCFAVGTIPIYWGADNITDYIPKNCFIDRRDFKNDAELIAHLLRVSEEEYKKYKSNILQFLNSDKAQVFSPDQFVHCFFEALNIDDKGRA